MPTRLLQLDDLRQIQTPDKIASLFCKLGYNARSSQLDVKDLELPARSTEATKNAYLVANQGNSKLQVILFHLHSQEFSSPSVASNRMRSIAKSLCRRPTNFLLLGTKDYNQLMLVNPRKSFDEQMNLRVGIRKLLIDRTNPTNYDRDRLEAIAAHNKNPQELYQAQCEAFDVEKLTKQFFKGYKTLFDRVQQVIKEHNAHSYFENQDRLHQFSQRLLGRIMFLYFLQKKEFLTGDRSFLTTQYRKLKSDVEDTDYYIDVLEPLFFETLNKYRADMESAWGKIPYLNGGLFDRDYGKDVKDAAGLKTPNRIEIPNSLFDPGDSKSVLNFFNSYNFTVAENVEGDEDVAVDPEMLGKVFENMLEVEERGKSGTFYTPRGIVHFMCSEVLSRYLSDETGMDLETVKKIIEFDPEQPANYFKELISPQQARKLKLALQSLKCLDPAVGSAAFPMGMMQVILNAYQSIAEREGNPIKRGSLAMSRLKRNIIANNLYGVDIKPEAIEIAKLRMWLSLVVDIPDIDDVEPLPNLEYKLMCGDSLISTINGEVLIPDPVTNKDAIQLQLKVTPIQQAIQPLLELQQQYFDAQTDERSQLKKKILEAEANIFKVAIAERRGVLESEDQRLNKTISRKSKLTKNTEKKKAAIAAQISGLDKLLTDVENRKRSLSFFQYYLHFRDVFEVKGGFDIVIGNPPYGIIYDEERKNSYELTYSSFLRNNDIYVAFYEKGINLLSNSGYFSYITPNTFLNGDYFKKLRKFLTQNTEIKEIKDYKEVKVFDDPTVFVCVFVGCKQESISYPYKIKLNTAKETINEFEANAININEASESELKPNNTLLDKLSNQSRYTFLDELFFVKDVGFNYWTKGGCKKRGGNSIGKRVFYKGERQNLKDVPFLKGRNVEKWLINSPNNYLRHNYQDFLNETVDTLRFSSNYLENDHKVVYRQTANKIIASIDTNSLYLDKTVHLIVPKENWNVFPSHLLLGILNSKLLLYIYTYISQETEKRAFSQVKTTYIKKIPVPKNWNVFTGKKIIQLVKEIIQLKEKDNTQDLTDLEKAIDTLVYSLYDLTSEEIAIIENYVNTQT